MTELRDIFNIMNKVVVGSENGHHFPPKIYTDVAELKHERERA